MPLTVMKTECLGKIVTEESLMANIVTHQFNIVGVVVLEKIKEINEWNIMLFQNCYFTYIIAFHCLNAITWYSSDVYCLIVVECTVFCTK